MPDADPGRAAHRLGAMALLTFAVFAIWPQIDLWASGMFHDPVAGFWIDDLWWPDLVRRAIWALSGAMVILSLAGVGLGLGSGRAMLGVPLAGWGYIALLYALGPGLLVDGLLKRYWGRARPAQISEFGGPLNFTAPHEMTDACSRNCSFVAGEVAGAVALTVALMMILAVFRSRMTLRNYRIGRGVAVGLAVIVGVQRIAAGRHFLSDVLLSALFVLLVALGLAAVFRAFGAAGTQRGGC